MRQGRAVPHDLNERRDTARQVWQHQQLPKTFGRLHGVSSVTEGDSAQADDTSPAGGAMSRITTLVATGAPPTRCFRSRPTLAERPGHAGVFLSLNIPRQVAAQSEGR